jgi:hypothetical protein
VHVKVQTQVGDHPTSKMRRPSCSKQKTITCLTCQKNTNVLVQLIMDTRISLLMQRIIAKQRYTR